jgi:hypothetical protein
MTRSSNAKRNVPHAPHAGEMLNQSARPGGVYPSSHKRVAGENGTFPVNNDGDPRRPVIVSLYEDLDRPRRQPKARYGQYPRSFIRKILPWLRCARHEVLHVCSGCLPPGEGIRVDRDPAAAPDVLADGRRLPFRDGSIAAVLLDPPYTEHYAKTLYGFDYAKTLYGFDYPRPSHLLREAARVVRPGGRIGFVHYITPKPPSGTTFVKAFGLSTGFDMPMRAVTIYERQHGLELAL